MLAELRRTALTSHPEIITRGRYGSLSYVMHERHRLRDHDEVVFVSLTDVSRDRSKACRDTARPPIIAVVSQYEYDWEITDKTDLVLTVIALRSGIPSDTNYETCNLEISSALRGVIQERTTEGTNLCEVYRQAQENQTWSTLLKSCLWCPLYYALWLVASTICKDGVIGKTL